MGDSMVYHGPFRARDASWTLAFGRCPGALGPRRRQLWRGPSAQTGKIRQRHQTAARMVDAGDATVARLPESVLPSWHVWVDTDREEASTYVVDRRHRLCPVAACELKCEDCLSAPISSRASVRTGWPRSCRTSTCTL